ncbi:MAG: DEAD/DEAH box helicase [Spirochaetes bacterium]|nr:MAG: DEAD/DEAH box helicase [Spirochaetota bacterium]
MEKSYYLKVIKLKLKKADSVYDLAHQQYLAKVDSNMRNWLITYKSPHFEVTDSNETTETVFRANTIGGFYVYDCTCHDYYHNKSGTCMHIEAVKRLPTPFLTEINQELKKLNNYQYYHSYYEKIITVGQPKYKTKSFAKYETLIKNESIFEIGLEIKVDSEIFSSYGISLRDYQVHSIEKMLRNKKTVLCLRMGLGKTLCGLACLYYLRPKKTLIVAPNNLKYQWKKQIDKLGLGFNIVIDKASDIKKIGDENVIILSYQMLNSNIEYFKSFKYDVLIADEIQKVKNNESQTWNNMSLLESDYTFTLSGTPVENHINDLISIIHLLNKDEFKPMWKFYHTFCNYSKIKILGVKRDMVKELKDKIDRYIINPKIDESKFDIPDLINTEIICKLDADSKATHDKYFDLAIPILAKAFSQPLTIGEKAALNGYLTNARMASTDSRMFDLENSKSFRFERIENLIKEITVNSKVVVFSEWIKATNLLEDFLIENGIQFVYFNSKLSAKQKQLNLERFIEDENCKVFLSTDSGGVGVDGLQFVSSNIVHIEKVWNPAKIHQRNGRLVRSLQPMKQVNAYYFNCESEVENMIDAGNQRKTVLFDDLFKFNADS